MARYNSFVRTPGYDQDFGKPKPLYKIATPPFYAAWATPVVHDTRAGLPVNARCQVVDINGEVDRGPLLRRQVGRPLQPAWPRSLYMSRATSPAKTPSANPCITPEHRITSFELLMPTLWCSRTAVASAVHRRASTLILRTPVLVACSCRSCGTGRGTGHREPDERGDGSCPGNSRRDARRADTGSSAPVLAASLRIRYRGILCTPPILWLAGSRGLRAWPDRAAQAGARRACR